MFLDKCYTVIVIVFEYKLIR